MCFFKDGQEIAVGMSDGNLLLLISDQVRMKSSFVCKEIGGIWSVCGVNKDQELAVGTISGIYILSFRGKLITRIDSEHYLQGMNCWNVREYDVNKLICTTWKDSNCYMIDRNQSDVKRISIHDPDYMNMHATDLVPLPSYDPI